MAGMFDALEKRLDPIAKAFKGASKGDAKYDRQEFYHYVNQFPLQMEEFIDQVLEMMSGGSPAETLAEFEKNKEVRVWSNTLRTTYSMIQGGMGEQGKMAKLAATHKKELMKVVLDFKNMQPKATTPDDKKKVKELEPIIKGLQKTLEACEAGGSKEDKAAIDIAKVKLDKHFADAIATAEKRPKKKVKELPDDFSEAAFSKKEKELKARERELTELPKKILTLKDDGVKDIDDRAGKIRKEKEAAEKEIKKLMKNEVKDPGPTADKEQKKAFKEWALAKEVQEKILEKTDRAITALGKDLEKDNKSKVGKMREYVDSLDSAYLELKQYAASLEKAEKEFGIALKASKHVKLFGEFRTRALKLSAQFKAQHKLQSKVEFNEDIQDFG